MTPRQFCCECFITVGTMPNGEERPYTTTFYADGRRFHRCADVAACARRSGHLQHLDHVDDEEP